MSPLFIRSASIRNDLNLPGRLEMFQQQIFWLEKFADASQSAAPELAEAGLCTESVFCKISVNDPGHIAGKIAKTHYCRVKNAITSNCLDINIPFIF